jgi:hypothetical protein
MLGITLAAIAAGGHEKRATALERSRWPKVPKQISSEFSLTIFRAQAAAARKTNSGCGYLSRRSVAPMPQPPIRRRPNNLVRREGDFSARRNSEILRYSNKVPEKRSRLRFSICRQAGLGGSRGAGGDRAEATGMRRKGGARLINKAGRPDRGGERKGLKGAIFF